MQLGPANWKTLFKCRRFAVVRPLCPVSSLNSKMHCEIAWFVTRAIGATGEITVAGVF